MSPTTYVQRFSNPSFVAHSFDRSCEDFGQIQDQAGEMRLCFEKSANQTPVPPTYVADCLNTANKKPRSFRSGAVGFN